MGRASRKKEVCSCNSWLEKNETFVVYIVLFKSPSNIQKYDVHPSCKVQIAASMANKALTSILTKYSDFADVFSPELASELLEHIEIKDHAIKFVDDWEPPYGLIYNLRSVELETLKTYIEINLANSFMRLSKSPVKPPIFYDKKPNGSLQLCVDYWELNNLTIKKQYPLPLVEKSLNWLGQARRFTQLDFISGYHWIQICKRD